MRAIKRMKEIQKIQILFYQNNIDPARTRTWNLLLVKKVRLVILKVSICYPREHAEKKKLK